MIGARWYEAQRPMWPPSVVVGAVSGKDGPQVSFAQDEDAVVSWVLAVKTKRSAKQFARGHRGGIFDGVDARPCEEGVE
jgi:hypothetical protein